MILQICIYYMCIEYKKKYINLGGGFEYFLFSPLPGEDSPFD